MLTWTVIRVGLHNSHHFSSFHIQELLSPEEAKEHALRKINGDWSNPHSDYLRNCIELGNFTVTTETN
jgi:hypothetical protein